MHEPLTNLGYLGKKLFFNFLGAHFVVPKSDHRCEKQPIIGPALSHVTCFCLHVLEGAII